MCSIPARHYELQNQKGSNLSRELLFSVTKKDLKITWFSGKGSGGQYRNKHQNCCRIQHKESGVIVTGQDERSQKQNLKNAFLRLTRHPNFQKWLRIKASEIMVGKFEIEKIVDELMQPENLKVEYF